MYTIDEFIHELKETIEDNVRCRDQYDELDDDENWGYIHYDMEVDYYSSMLKWLHLLKTLLGKCSECKYYYIDEDGCGYHCEYLDGYRIPTWANNCCEHIDIISKQI